MTEVKQKMHSSHKPVFRRTERQQLLHDEIQTSAKHLERMYPGGSAAAKVLQKAVIAAPHAAALTLLKMATTSPSSQRPSSAGSVPRRALKGGPSPAQAKAASQLRKQMAAQQRRHSLQLQQKQKEITSLKKAGNVQKVRAKFEYKHARQTGRTKQLVRNTFTPPRTSVSVQSNRDGTEMRVKGHEFLGGVNLTVAKNVPGGIIDSRTISVLSMTDSRIKNYAQQFEAVTYHSWEYRFIPMSGNMANGRFVSYTNMDSAEPTPPAGDTGIKVAYNHAGSVATNVSDINSQRMPRMVRSEPMYINQVENTSEAKRNTIPGTYYLICDIPYNYQGQAPADDTVIGDLVVYYDVTFSKPATTSGFLEPSWDYFYASAQITDVLTTVAAAYNATNGFAGSSRGRQYTPLLDTVVDYSSTPPTTAQRQRMADWSLQSDGTESFPVATNGVEWYHDETNGVFVVDNPVPLMVVAQFEADATFGTWTGGGNIYWAAALDLIPAGGYVSGDPSCVIASRFTNNYSHSPLLASGATGRLCTAGVWIVTPAAGEERMCFSLRTSASYTKIGTVTGETPSYGVTRGFNMVLLPISSSWSGYGGIDEADPVAELKKELAELKQQVSAAGAVRAEIKDAVRKETVARLADQKSAGEPRVPQDAKGALDRADKLGPGWVFIGDGPRAAERLPDTEAISHQSVRGLDAGIQAGVRRDAAAGSQPAAAHRG